MKEASQKANARTQRKASRALAQINDARIKAAHDAEGGVDGSSKGAGGDDDGTCLATSRPLSEKLARRVTIASGYSSSKLTKAIVAHGSLVAATLTIVILFAQVIFLATDRAASKTLLASIDGELQAIDPNDLNAAAGPDPSCVTPAPFCCAACAGFDLNCSAGCIDPPSAGFQSIVGDSFPGARECCPGPDGIGNFPDALELMFSLTLIASIIAIVDGIHHAYRMYQGGKLQNELDERNDKEKEGAKTKAAGIQNGDGAGAEPEDGEADGYLNVVAMPGSASDGVDVEAQAIGGDGSGSSVNSAGSRINDADDSLGPNPLDPTLFQWNAIPSNPFKLFVWKVRVLLAGKPPKIQNHANFNASAPVGSMNNPIQSEYAPKPIGNVFYVLPAVNFALFIFIKALQVGELAAGEPISCFGCAGSHLWSQGVDIVGGSTKRATKLGTALTAISVLASLFTFASVNSRDTEETFYAAFKDSVMDLAEQLGLVPAPPPAQPLQPNIALNQKAEVFSISCHPFDKVIVADGSGGGSGGKNVDGGANDAADTEAVVPPDTTGVLLVYTLDGSLPALDAKFERGADTGIGPYDVNGTIVESTTANVSAAKGGYGINASEIRRCRAIAVRWQKTGIDGMTRATVSNETVCELNGDVLSTLSPHADNEAKRLKVITGWAREFALTIAASAKKKADAEAAVLFDLIAQEAAVRELKVRPRRPPKEFPPVFTWAGKSWSAPTGAYVSIEKAEHQTDSKRSKPSDDRDDAGEPGEPGNAGMRLKTFVSPKKTLQKQGFRYRIKQTGQDYAPTPESLAPLLEETVGRGVHPDLYKLNIEVDDVLVTRSDIDSDIFRGGRVVREINGTNETVKCTVRYVSETLEGVVECRKPYGAPFGCFNIGVCTEREECWCNATVREEEEMVDHELARAAYGEDWYLLWPTENAGEA